MKNIERFTSQKKYIPQLDGIRGLAILLVVTFHYFGFLKIFSFGWTGVDLFFVLSGYLITSRLYASKNEKNYFSRFYINRALRILPVYYVTLIFFYAGFNLLLNSENVAALSFYNTNWWSFLLFFENWSFIYAPQYTNHLQHFWTLAVEEQFYIIWPSFFFIFSEKTSFYKIIFLILIAIITMRCIIYLHYPRFEDCPHFFYNTFCRMDSFIIGGCVFLLKDKKNMKLFQYYFLIPLVLIATGIYFTNTKQANQFTSTAGYTLLALLFAGLINFITLNPNSLVSKFFKISWLKFTGKISYGLYIYHWLVLIVLQPKLVLWLNTFLVKEDLIYWLSLAICLIISVVISVISYFYFESYFLRLKK